ncbi:MAG: ABC transporter ATP-binding protein [Acidobacteria bacterium]|nr:ABC transporter ATP-binding protein [Acidobacteriota bacterium]
MIHLRHVSKQFTPGGPPAVADLTLHARRGQFLALVGRSGSGKTTTLKMINRLLEPSAGHIEVEGLDIAGRDPVLLRRHMGYVFQGGSLFPHMDVAANVALVPRLLGWDEARISSRVEELLDLVGLPPASFAHRLPRELSGGQGQRVSLARALAGRPPVLLLDEPFGALDPLTRDDLQRELSALHRRLELTTLLVTHDMAEALLLADRIAVMEAGRLLQYGTPHEILTSPVDEVVRRLIATPKRQGARIDDLLRDVPGESA